MDLRPQVEEVVAHLGVAAADWDGVMPPCKAKIVASDSNDPMRYDETRCVREIDFIVMLPIEQSHRSNLSTVFE